MLKKGIETLGNNVIPVTGISYIGYPTLNSSHKHEQAQLMYCSKGIVEIQVADKILLVPPTNAIWIPSNTPHAALSKKKINFHSLYFDTNQLTKLPKETQVISITPLFRELIFEVCSFSDKNISREKINIIDVIIDQINSAQQQKYILSMPNSKTIKSVYEFIYQNLSEALSVEQIGSHFAMSGKTLTRVFQKHTGMTFEQWRQQIKILEAITLLTYGATTTEVSQSLGYSSDSAFIYRFKRVTGKTPKEFRNISSA